MVDEHCAKGLSSAETTGALNAVKVACTCGHDGIVSAKSLPRNLTCWQCGASRRVEVRDRARIRNPVAVMERILGEPRPIDAAGGG